MGDCIRYKSTLSPRLREIAILMVARHWSAHYEWHAHRKMSEDAGVEPAIADAIGDGKEPANLSADDRLVWQFSREVLIDHDVSDATYAAALARFDEPGIIDLVATLGYFSFVSMILNTARVPVPEGGSKLAPLGR
jgi:4-carboxymuconolactone decarboxylase